jgi:hypothetical protein
MEQQSLYEQTAEVRARNKTILWWILALSYGGDDNAYFPGKTFDDKLAVYDELSEEEDDFINTVIQRLTYFVSFWFVGRASTQEEFDAMLREQGLQEIEEEEQEDLDAQEELPVEDDTKATQDIVLENVVSEEKPAEEKPAEVKPKKNKKTKKKAPVKKELKNDDDNNPEEPTEQQETE